MRLNFSKPFKKKLQQVPEKIQSAFGERLELFISNPFEPLLNNHALNGKYQGCRSFNITGDWRAIFREFNNYTLVSFETLGTHSQLYKK